MAECQRSLLQAQRKALPIASARDALLREIRSHDCCVVVGETGSGKTTQIPQVREPTIHTHAHTLISMYMYAFYSLSLSSGKLEYEFLSPPQYILESGLGRKGCVGVTQPRRVAAVSIAIRVALERCCPLGQEVL